MGKVIFNPSTEIPAQTGRVILVTGGNEGLGKETVLQLAKHEPAKILLTARTQEKADNAIADIKKRGGPDLAPIEFVQLDLSSFDSIKKAAADVKSRTPRLDVLIANAGNLGGQGVTKEGYEWMFGVNFVGTSLFVRLLLPLLETTASLADTPEGLTRVVFLTSFAEAQGPKEYPLDIIKSDLKKMGLWERYGQSKLANAHYAAQLAKHYPEATSGVRFVSVHPGGVNSQLGDDVLTGVPSFIKRPIRKISNLAMGVVPTSEGVWNQLWAATATRQSSKLGEPKEGVLYWPVAVEGKASARFHDERQAERLWEWTEKELSAHLQI